MKTERALSDVIGIILIICLVLVLAIVIIGLFFGNLPLQQKSAYILPEVSDQVFYNKNILVVFHRGGEEVYVGSTDIGRNHMGVYLDTTTGSGAQVQPDTGVNVLKPGSALYIYNTTSGYRMTTNSTVLKYSTAKTIEICPLSLRLVDENAKLLIGQWNWSDCTPTGPAPTVSNLNSSTGYRGWPAVRLVNGANFLVGAKAKLNRSDGIADIGADGCTYISSRQLLCTFDLAGKIPSLPRYNVVVTNPDGKQGMLRNYFTLTSNAPTLSSSTPGSGKQGTTITIRRLAGNYFQPDSVISFQNGTTTLPFRNVNVISMSNITGTLEIPVTAPIGRYRVTVTNPFDSKTVTREGMFTVTSNAPTVTSLNSTSGWAGWVAVKNITGTNFQNGATAMLNGTTPVISTGPCTYRSATVLTCSFDLTSVTAASAANAYNVVVTNPDGKQGMRKNYFTITSAAPTVRGNTPASGSAGTTVTITNLIGTNFQTGTAVTYYNGSASFPMTVTGVPLRTRITGTLDIPSGTPAGTYYVRVTNPDGQTGTTAGRIFRVYADAKPAISGVSPLSGQRGTSVPVTVTGTGFLSGARVRLYNGSTSVYTAPAGIVTSTRITTFFNVSGTVAPAIATVRVTNTDGQYATYSSYTIQS